MQGRQQDAATILSGSDHKSGTRIRRGDHLKQPGGVHLARLNWSAWQEAPQNRKQGHGKRENAGDADHGAGLAEGATVSCMAMAGNVASDQSQGVVIMGLLDGPMACLIQGNQERRQTYANTDRERRRPL